MKHIKLFESFGIYHQCVLNESKKERLIDKFRPQLEEISDDIEDFDVIDLAEMIVDEDPSVTKKYSEWGIKKFIDTVKNPEKFNYPDEVSGGISELIYRYHDILETLSPKYVENMFNFLNLYGLFTNKEIENNIKLKPKDINSFGTVEDLDYFIKKYTEFLSVNRESKKIKEEVEKIYEDDRFLIVRPLSHRASCYYGANTKWCTTSKNNDEKFKQNTKEANLYYIIDKKSKSNIYGKMALRVHHDKDFDEYYEVYDQKNDFVSLNLLLQKFKPIQKKIIELINKNEIYEKLREINSCRYKVRN
jgi:hypothetical protein